MIWPPPPSIPIPLDPVLPLSNFHHPLHQPFTPVELCRYNPLVADAVGSVEPSAPSPKIFPWAKPPEALAKCSDPSMTFPGPVPGVAVSPPTMTLGPWM